MLHQQSLIRHLDMSKGLGSTLYEGGKAFYSLKEDIYFLVPSIVIKFLLL